MGLQLLLLILLIRFLVLAAPSLSLPNQNCPTSCGYIPIPYPFGIGSGCSYNSWFEIDCRVTNDTASPFLKMVNLELLDSQYLPYLLVKIPVISQNCSATTGVNEEDVVHLEGSPFFFSVERNWFFAVGCNNIAALTYDQDINKTVGGCMSTCDSNGTISRGDLGNIGDNIICYGTKCCQTTLPPYLQTFKPSFRSLEPPGGNGSCRSSGNFKAFIVYRRSLSSNTFREAASNRYSTVALEWGLINTTQQQLGLDKGTTFCQQKDIQIRANGSFHNITSLSCECRTPSIGNPYLPDGCSCSKNPEMCYTGKTSKSKAIIIGVCSALGALVFLILAWFLFKVLKKKIAQKRKEKFFKRNGGLLLQQKLFSSGGRVEETKLFNSNELEKATDRFNRDRILGQGGQGTVYKGMLSDGRIVAVKKSKLIDEGSIGQFINEVVILSRINHRNVVKLFGCCLETDVPLLVYEFVPNGTLFQYIRDPNEEFLLTWERRLQIATEIAGAFSYLHYAASVPIYHRDIKSTNILLDDKYKAKVSDFGTSRTISIDQTHMTTLVQGTFGYLDPEFFRSSQFTEKSDVYSFGVVIVELLTGRKPISTNEFQEHRSLAAIFVEAMEENKLMEILDPFIIKEDWKEETMVVADIARRCLSLNGKMRPTMKEVAVELEGVRMCRGGGQTTPLGQKQQTHGRVVEYDDMNSYLDTSSTSRETCSMDSSWGTSSTSTGTCSYKTTASTLDADPLLLNKPCDTVNRSVHPGQQQHYNIY